MKCIIINADDFGYCPERNKGIVECFESNSISSTSLLVNGLFADEASQLALEKHIPIGLHFNITEGRPVADPSLVKSLINESSGLFLGKFGLRDALESNIVDPDHVSCLFLLCLFK